MFHQGAFSKLVSTYKVLIYSTDNRRIFVHNPPERAVLLFASVLHLHVDGVLFPDFSLPIVRSRLLAAGLARAPSSNVDALFVVAPASLCDARVTQMAVFERRSSQSRQIKG